MFVLRSSRRILQSGYPVYQSQGKVFVLSVKKIVQMNQTFITNQIRKYTKAKRQSLKNSALIAIGVHVELLRKEDIFERIPTDAEFQRVLYFVRQFCLAQNLPFLEP